MLTEVDPNAQAGESMGRVEATQPSSVSASAPDQAGDQPLVALEGVHKRFNDIYALRNISMSILPGEVFSLLGPTGSGKSTLVRLLLGFLQPDEGTVTLFGSTDPRSVANRIGYMPERPYYHHNFTGRDYLFFQARLSGLTRAGARRAVERAIEAVGLGPVARRRIRFYERETLQRLALAVAMVSVAGGPPGLLILDEPSESLTRTVQLSVRDAILDLKQRGATILIASHRITEIERVSTSVGILRGGRLMTQTYVENNPRVIIVAAPREGSLESYDRLLAHLRNLHPFVTLTGGRGAGGEPQGAGTAPLVMSLPSGPHIRNAAGIKASALRALVDAGWDVISVYVERKDLESIYVQTAPPQPQSVGSAATGPLPKVTSPLGPGAASMNTVPMPNLAQAQQAFGAGNNTRPLYASEVGEMAGGGDPSSATNGHQPIEGRTLRKEQK